MRDSLARVLTASTQGRVVEQWDDAATRIAAERAQVEAAIAQNPSRHIYGFTTLYGQLDSRPTESVDQPELLRAHLVGAPRDVPGEFIALATYCKIEQLHHGGSGLHPATYNALTSFEQSSDDATGGWLSSYGSGDVVPAAWWIRAALPPATYGNLRQGDLIALLNGSFYSTAFGIAAGLAAVHTLAGFLRRAARLCSYPDASRHRGAALLSPDLAAYFARHRRTVSSESAQLPISLRDADAYLAPIAIAVDALGEALEQRLAHSSANPLFTFEYGTVDAESQSSFLDLPLTLALTNVAQALQLAIRASQRFVVHLTAEPDESSSIVRPLQPSKVAMAVVERASLIGGQLPVQFTGSDSDGVEDVRDLSLLTASTVLDLVALAHEALAIVDTVSPAPPEDSEPLDALLALLTDDADLNPVALFDRFAAMRGPFVR